MTIPEVIAAASAELDKELGILDPLTDPDSIFSPVESDSIHH